MDYIKNVFSANSKYTNSSQDTLNIYGSYPIVNLQVRKQPIISIIDKMINLISLNKYQEIKDKSKSFDKLYHLFVVVGVKLPNNEVKNILIEKNQSINISQDIPEVTKDTMRLTIAIPNKFNLTLNDLLTNTLNKVGSDRFFIYRPFNDQTNGGNCQRFISDVLDSNGLLGQSYSKWILQDITELVKGLPRYVKYFSKGVTDFASTLEKAVGGDKEDKLGLWALHVLIIKKPCSKADLERYRHDFIKNKKLTFIRETETAFKIRNIPATKFIRTSHRTKIVNPKISLVYGKLKKYKD